MSAELSGLQIASTNITSTADHHACDDSAVINFDDNLAPSEKENSEFLNLLHNTVENTLKDSASKPTDIKAQQKNSEHSMLSTDGNTSACQHPSQSVSGEEKKLPINPAASAEQIITLIQDLLAMLQSGSKTPQPPNDTPAPITSAGPGNNTPQLVNTVIGGTGQAQRDMDPNKTGTQIHVVIQKGMNQSDRAKSLEALQQWADVSQGELNFLVYEEGEQPGGEDFILMKAVPPDNTAQAGMADVGRSPDGVTELEFESGTDLAVVMHEIGHTLGLRHSDGVLKAVNATTEFTQQNLADLAALYPTIGQSNSASIA